MLADAIFSFYNSLISKGFWLKGEKLGARDKEIGNYFFTLMKLYGYRLIWGLSNIKTSRQFIKCPSYQRGILADQ